MSDSKFLQGFTGFDLRLPHTGQVIRCKVPNLKQSAEIIRLFEASKADDGKVADLMDVFPAAIGHSAEVFDGLSPAEFLQVVTGFFSVRRDLEEPTSTPSDSASSSTGPT